VFHVTPEDENLGALLETSPCCTASGDRPALPPEIRQGDKRIILIEAKPWRRLARAATRRGPRQFPRRRRGPGDRADKREQDICAAIGPTLREQGLVFVGIDVIATT